MLISWWEHSVRYPLNGDHHKSVNHCKILREHHHLHVCSVFGNNCSSIRMLPYVDLDGSDVANEMCRRSVLRRPTRLGKSGDDAKSPKNSPTRLSDWFLQIGSHQEASRELGSYREQLLVMPAAVRVRLPKNRSQFLWIGPRDGLRRPQATQRAPGVNCVVVDPPFRIALHSGICPWPGRQVVITGRQATG